MRCRLPFPFRRDGLLSLRGAPGVLVLAVWLVALAPVRDAAAQDDGRVDVDIEVGYDSTIKRGRWYPVRVVLRNRFQDEKVAYVTLTRAHAPHDRPQAPTQPRLVLTQRVELAAADVTGIPFDYHLFFLCPPLVGEGEAARFAVEVREGSRNGPTLLRRRRDERRRRDDGTSYIIIHWDPYDYAVGQARQALDELQTDATTVVLTAGTGTGSWPISERRAQDVGEVARLVHRMDLVALPDHWLGYDGVDVVCLANPDWEQFEQSFRAQPLLDWVRSGGHLVLALSRDPARVSHPRTRFDQWAGITVQQAAALPRQSLVVEVSSDDLVAEPARMAVNLADTTQEPVPILRVEPRAGTRVLAYGTLLAAAAEGDEGEGEGSASAVPQRVPVILQRPLGLGTVTTFVFDPSSSAVNAPRTSLAAYLENGLLHGAWRTHVFAAPPEASDYENGFRLRSESVMSRLRRAVTIRSAEIPFMTLLLFLGLFVLVIGPLDYLLLGLINRRSWTWVTFTVAVLAFFLMAEYGTENLRGGRMTLEQLTVRTMDAAGTVETGEVFASAFPQSNEDFEIWIDRRNAHAARMETPMQIGTYNDYGDPFYSGSRFRGDGQTPWDHGRDVVIAQPYMPDGPKREGPYLAANPMTRWVTRHIQAGWLDVPNPQQARRGTGEDPNGEAGPDSRAGRLLLERQPDGSLRLTNHTGRPLTGMVLVAGGRRVHWLLRAEPAVPDAVLPAGESRSVPSPHQWTRVDETSLIIESNRRDAPAHSRNNSDYGWSDNPSMAGLDADFYDLWDMGAVRAVLLATVADWDRRAYRFRGKRLLQLDTLHRLNLSRALRHGAIVAVGWTSLQADSEPPVPLRVGGNDPQYLHREIIRVVLWP